MIVSREAFNALLAPDGPDVSISFYHECLHSIAFTHAKILSIPRHHFLDPDSPSAPDGAVSVCFLPHWRGRLLLPLFSRLLRLHLKPQLRLSDDDYTQILSSFDDLSSSELDEVLSLSSKQLGRHLHIIRSVSLLEQLCHWTTSDPPLDLFLHIGGTPMIVIGDILIREDVQNTLSRLLDHVGTPSLASHRSSRSRAMSRHSRASTRSSRGSRTGTHISFPTPPRDSSPALAVHSASTVEDPPPPILPLPIKLITPSSTSVPSSLPPVPEDAPLPSVVAPSPVHSACFPNVC